jgi:hypothetical protein
MIAAKVLPVTSASRTALRLDVLSLLDGMGCILLD